MRDGPHGRRLVLVRHAAAVQGGADEQRALLPEGRADARAAGVWLAEELALVPDLVLCSTADRAQQTWQAMAEHPALTPVPVWRDRRIYNAPPSSLLETIHEVPGQASVVLLVGHAPVVPALAAGLTDLQHEDTDESAWQGLHQGFATMTCAVLAPATAWAELAGESAALLQVHSARAGR